MGFVETLIQRIPLFFLLLGLAAFGLGRRASRTNVGAKIPDWAGFALIGVAVVLWIVINFVVGVGDDGGGDAAAAD